MTHTYFSVLGVRPILGRPFLAEDDDQTQEPTVAVLSFRFWRDQFGKEESILGKTILISNRICTVVGVAPEGFTGADSQDIDVWLPASSAPGGASTSSVGLNWVRIVGRLRTETTLEQAKAEIVSFYPAALGNVVDARGNVPSMESRINLLPLYEPPAQRVSRLDPVLVSLTGGGLALLLIACTNVASLLLNRAVQRRQEIAIRLQLGATQSRILTQLITESLLLTAASGLICLLFVDWTVPLLTTLLNLPLSRWDVVLNPRLFLMTAVFALLCTTISCLGPALYIRKADIGALLKARGGRDRYGSLVRNGLLTAQVSFTAILLLAAALFARSLDAARSLNFGIDPRNVIVASVDLRTAGHAGPEINAIYAKMLESVRMLPGVWHAGSTMMIPFFNRLQIVWSIPGREWRELPYGIGKPAGRGPFVNAVSSEYFETMGMKILKGRGFVESDTSASAPVVVINERMARDIWLAEEALGKCIVVGRTGPCREIVGIVESARIRVEQSERDIGEDNPGFYFLLDQWHETPAFAPSAILMRVDGGAATTRAILDRLHATMPELPYIKVGPLENYLDNDTRQWRSASNLFGTFAILASLLAAVGIYSVLTFFLKQRTQELGIRLALGATRADILRLAIRIGMVPVMIGLVSGLLCGLALTQFLKSILFGVNPTDFLSIIFAALTLVVVGLVASIVPATRAAQTDPAVSLRAE